MATTSTSRVLLLTLLTAVATAAALAPTASAAGVRYAGPKGGGTSCSAAVPCALTDAVSGATGGETVVVKPGDYLLTSTLNTPTAITIRGADGEPRPRLFFNGGGQSGIQPFPGSKLSHLEIRQLTTAPALVLDHAAADRLLVKGPGVNGLVQTRYSTIRSSLVVANGDGASAILTKMTGSAATSYLRNVTAVAPGSHGIGVELQQSVSHHSQIHLYNTIAKGGPAGLGLYIWADGITAKATITARHSNFVNYLATGTGAQYSNAGGNQGVAPTFVNALDGDYRQAAGSVTIGAGGEFPENGVADLDGDPRAIGTPDIGADEFVFPPAAATGAADSITGASAVLRGSVNPKGAPTTYRFEYGPTAAYGSATAAVAAGSGKAEVAAAAKLQGLKARTTYHYRVAGTNAGGSTHGADRTFTTGALLDGSPAPDVVFAGVTLASKRLSARGRFVALRLKCPAGTAGACSGRTRLTARRVTIGRARFTIAAGTTAKVRVRVSRRGRRLLAHTRRLRGRDRNVAADGAGRSKATSSAVTIRRR